MHCQGKLQLFFCQKLQFKVQARGMPAVMAQESFEERQKELCLLSSFISEQEEWLQSWLSALGWTLESLQRPVSNRNKVYSSHHCFTSTHHTTPHDRNWSSAHLIPTITYHLHPWTNTRRNADMHHWQTRTCMHWTGKRSVN